MRARASDYDVDINPVTAASSAAGRADQHAAGAPPGSPGPDESPR